MKDGLGGRLEQLVQATDRAQRVANDPIAYPRRYSDPRDIEIAAIVAGSLAFGRVAAFRPVLDRIFAAFDEQGGPRAFVEAFGPSASDRFRDLVYRWHRGPDFALWFATLRRAIERYGTLGAMFPYQPEMRATLAGGIARLRAEAEGCASREFTYLPRGFRYFLPSPDDGSACKRWNMILRWLVRPDDGVDLGIWPHLSPALLIMPIDTHVGRIARMIGLTRRKDDSWRTAEEITAALRRVDPRDPVRFDFALAHLGISGECASTFVPAICGTCALRDGCIVAEAAMVKS